MGTHSSGGASITVPFYLPQVSGQDSVTEYKELWIMTKGVIRKSDSGRNPEKRHYSSAGRSAYYVRVNTSELDCGYETKDIEVSRKIYDTVVPDSYHEFQVITDTLPTGKKRVRIYY